MARVDGAQATVAAVVAVTAAIFSPRLRGLLRRGTVQGVAGVLIAGDALASFARGVSRGIQGSTDSAAKPAESARDAPAVSSTNPAESDDVAGPPGGSPSEAATPAATPGEVSGE